jgi:hypothetical protein
MDDLVERVAVELIAMRLASYDDQARAITSMVLEHAAKVAENCKTPIDDFCCASAFQKVAAAIRAIGAP